MQYGKGGLRRCRCRVWKLKENDNCITYQKNVEKAGLCAAACGEGDMEGDWNTLKTCLLKNAENVCGVIMAHPSERFPGGGT